MTTVIDACTVATADRDAPQHQKVPASSGDAESQLQEELHSTATATITITTTSTKLSTPQAARERTSAQRKRDRKKGKNRHNNPTLPAQPAEGEAQGNNDIGEEDARESSSSSSSSSSSFPSSTESSFSSIPRSMAPPAKTAAGAAARTAGKIVPLFIASIGNPPPAYAHTLHSAGHTLLDAVRDLRAFPPWQKDRLLANGLVSRQAEAGASRGFSWSLGLLGGGEERKRKKKKEEGGGSGVREGEEDWTLWQSPSLMNVSGRALALAFGRWKREHRDGELVVVHDELERGLGKVGLKRGGSAKGHNGLKDLAKQLPGLKYVRVGVGIGRPESREPDVVAQYVLRKMTPEERAKVEGCADEVIRKLWEVQEGRI